MIGRSKKRKIGGDKKKRDGKVYGMRTMKVQNIKHGDVVKPVLSSIAGHKSGLEVVLRVYHISNQDQYFIPHLMKD